MDRPLSDKVIKEQQRKRISKAVFYGAFFLIGLLAIRFFFFPSLKLEEIRTATVSVGTVKSTISAGGVVVPVFEETISSEFDTQLTKLFAKPGQLLQEGDLIMQLDNLSIKLAISNLEEQIALKNNQIESKRLNLEKAVNEVRSNIELLDVDIASKTSLATRYRTLEKKGITSKQELVEAELDIKRSNIEKKQHIQSIADLESATASEIVGLELEKSILRKEMDEQNRMLEDSTVVATRDGVLSWVKEDEGGSIAAQEPLAKIADTSQFMITANLSDFYSSQLTPGMEVEVAYRDDVISGTLETLAPTIENGVMRLMIALDQPDAEFLRNNLRVDVGLVTEIAEDVHTIPKGPFLNGRGIQKVFVIKEGIARSTTVTIGASNTNYFEVVDGVQEGDEVIISDVSDFIHLTEFKIN